MAIRDLRHNIKSINGLNIQSITTNTTTAGIEIDTKGYNSVTFVVKTGARTDGTVTPLIQESNTSGSYSGSVSDDDLIGLESESALAVAHTNSTPLGYKGNKRYVRASLVSTGVTSGLTATVDVILGDALENPVV